MIVGRTQELGTDVLGSNNLGVLARCLLKGASVVITVDEGKLDVTLGISIGEIHAFDFSRPAVAGPQ